MYKIFPLSLILRLDAIFTLARHVQLKIMPIPLFKTNCYQILVSKPFTRVFDFPPSDLMRPRYCRSADARMRMQNALLLQWGRIRQSTGWDFHTVQKYI